MEGKTEGGKRYALVSWKTIKQPRVEGGLQLRDLKLQNLAIGDKLLWNMLAPKPTWCSLVLKNKYFPGPRLRCLEGEHVKSKGTSIFSLCKKLLPSFIGNLYWILGNEKDIKIWQDLILGNYPPRLPRLQSWMETKGMYTIWSISAWEEIFPHRWKAWTLPDCPAELEIEKT